MIDEKEQNKIRIGMGERIRKERDAIGMSRSEFGNRIGVAEKTVKHIEEGGQGTTIYRLIEIAEVLNTSTDYLLRGYRDTLMKSEEEELANKAADYIRNAPPDERKPLLEAMDGIFNYGRKIKNPRT